MLELNKIYNMDCIEWMKLIPDWSIDCIITDPPYWTTACKRDNVIPFEPMRGQLKRIIKPNGAIVLFGSEPFSSALRMSNIKQYKYDWIWEKEKPSNPAIAKYQPLKYHEMIHIFWWKNYYPVMIKWNKNHSVWIWKRKWGSQSNMPTAKISYLNNPDSNMKYPKSVLKINREPKPTHPTQKPVALIEYLIRTYTNEWETVLDFTIWSWTTAIACINTNRNYIWFELDEWYYEIANKRIYSVITNPWTTTMM